MKFPKLISPVKFQSTSVLSSPSSSPRLESPSPASSPGSVRHFTSSKSETSPKSFSGRLQHLFEFSLLSPRNRPTRGPPSVVLEERHLKKETSARDNFMKKSRSLRQEFELVFGQFDANGDGKISAAELRDILRSLGDKITHEEALEMVKEVDVDGDGFIDLEEFINMNTKSVDVTGEIASVDELQAAFRVFDKDSNGLITPEELHSVLRNLGDENCTVDDCYKMIRGVDRNGDGFVDFDEFKVMMSC